MISKKGIELLDQLIDGDGKPPHSCLYTPHAPDGSPIDPRTLVTDGQLVTIGGLGYKTTYIGNVMVLFVRVGVI